MSGMQLLYKTQVPKMNTIYRVLVVCSLFLCQRALKAFKANRDHYSSCHVLRDDLTLGLCVQSLHIILFTEPAVFPTVFSGQHRAAQFV